MKTQPLSPAWLMCDGKVLASADIANTAKSRRLSLHIDKRITNWQSLVLTIVSNF